MPWKDTEPVMERARFIALYAEGLYTVTELCARFGISRKTGYKWLGRYEAAGLPGLAAQSRAPHGCPQRTPAETEAALVQAREAHPHWGPKKLIAYLRSTQPELALPAPSTAGAVLKRRGLVPARPRRRRLTHPASPPLVAAAPNAVWCADFKGEFRTRDGTLCYPLTVTDAYSRYLLGCQSLTSTAHAGAQETFTRLFAAYGLPAAIRTDNGTPFASAALGGLSHLAVWWIKLGIRLQRIPPGQPQANGRHERMHRTLKAETTRPPAADLPGQQARFDAFRAEFNAVRPHEALAQRPPGSLYRPSARELPPQLPTPAYAGHLLVRQVGSEGCIRLRSQRLFVSSVLAGEHVALEEVEEGLWSLYFYDVLLGRFTEQEWQLQG